MEDDIPIAPSLYSLSNKMDNSLLAVRDINHKYIVVEIDGKEIEMLKNLQINHVLSFNYTNTFERIYGNCRDGVKYHFIHGKADINNNVDTCNMILGIDEYLTDTKRDSDNEFIEFKKFFQRIYKGTGAEYKKWIHRIEKLRQEFNVAHCDPDEIYILGHSLDVSDRDVLSELLLCPDANVHIIYHNKKALADKIANVVKIIGQDKLIEKSYSENPQIDFIEQK